MKIRRGFVSNSSSTMFVFVFKTEHVQDFKQYSIQSLCNLINKYKDHFNLDCDGDKCTWDEVKEALQENLLNPDLGSHYNSKILAIEEAIEREKQNLKGWSRFLNDRDNQEWCLRFIDQSNRHLQYLKYAKETGLDTAVIAYFGDNDGPWAETTLGEIMDYEGRDIDIKEDDFIVLTEQNR